MIEQLESHQFEPVRVLQWRNRQLDFSSLNGLAQSLSKAPGMPGLTRAMRADDMPRSISCPATRRSASDAGSEDAVNVLWDVCQIPDYRNITGADHAALLGRVFRFLRSPSGTIPTDWFANRCPMRTGPMAISTLCRTASHISAPGPILPTRATGSMIRLEWQQRTRAVEDRLSDALHECLTQRFIDRRTRC